MNFFIILLVVFLSFVNVESEKEDVSKKVGDAFEENFKEGEKINGKSDEEKMETNGTEKTNGHATNGEKENGEAVNGKEENGEEKKENDKETKESEIKEKSPEKNGAAESEKAEEVEMIDGNGKQTSGKPKKLS